MKRFIVGACFIVPSDDVPTVVRVEAAVADALRQCGWLVKYCDAGLVEDAVFDTRDSHL